MRYGRKHIILEMDQYGLLLLFMIISVLFYSGVQNLMDRSLSINPIQALSDGSQISASSTQYQSLLFLALDSVQNNIHYKHQFGPGNWSEWMNLGGDVKQIDAANDEDGSVAVFGIGDRGNNTYYKHQFGLGGNWSDWTELGGDVKQIQARGVSSGTQIPDFLSILFPR